ERADTDVAVQFLELGWADLAGLIAHCQFMHAGFVVWTELKPKQVPREGWSELLSLPETEKDVGVSQGSRWRGCGGHKRFLPVSQSSRPWHFTPRHHYQGAVPTPEQA